MNMSKFPDREDIDLLSSDKIVKTKKLMHSNLKVALEVNLISEGEMDANYVNNTYHITDTFFLGQQCCIRHIYLGSLQQFLSRWNVLISNHCISDNTHTNPPGIFPEVIK